MRIRRWMGGLLIPFLIWLGSVPALAADSPGFQIKNPQVILPGPIQINPELLQTPVPVAFGAVANRYTNVDPATIFDLDGDLVGDLKVSGDKVTGQNGAKVQLVQPVALNLDHVQTVPSGGYSASAPLQLSRVYVAQLKGGTYAKFMVLQASPKVTLWFHHGVQTSSVLTANGDDSRAVLTWEPLDDAQLGYNIYRYEVDGNAYTVTLLNDFTVEGTTFTDNTAGNRYYLYVVQAIKAGGPPGSLTTTAAVFVTHKMRSLVIALNSTNAKLDGATVELAVKPAIRDGLMMVPASALTHAGVKVTFESASGKLTLSRRLDSVTYTAVMTVDSPDYTWNGTSYRTDVPPYKSGAEVMVPLRVVAPILGLGATFDSAARTATLGWSE